jgi:hypothetical protein
MKEKAMSIGLLGAAWTLGLVLPHFQSDPNFFELLLDSVVVLVIAYSLWSVMNIVFLNSLRVSYLLTASSVVLFLSGYFLLQMGSPTLYDLWSHLGSGTMEFDGSLFPFGDLVHFTAAATCVTGIKIGANACDPWQRAFNQNPDIPRVLDSTGLTNVDLLGIGSFLFLTLLLVLIIWKRNLKNIAFVIFIVSPPFVLAVDRGNEIISIWLILLGLISLESKNKYIQCFAIIFLPAAAIFKLWPVLLIALMGLYAKKTNRKYLLIAFAVSAGYWLISLGDIPKMISATQSGSPHGVAFGLKLFFSDQTTLINVGYLTTLAILITSLWVKYFGRSFTTALESTIRDPRFTVLIPTMLTYVGIWFISDSFIYRMLILLPALLILISEDLLFQIWAKGLVVGILVTVLSSRLAITTAISSALALIFLFVSIVYSWNRIQNYISQRQVSVTGISDKR